MVGEPTPEPTPRLSVEPLGNSSPVISFATPADGDEIVVGSVVSVVVNASDSDGSIDNVRLSVDGTFIRQENRDPYEWNDAELQGLSVGTHELTAVTTDNEGATATATISVEVVGEPSPDPTEPTDPTDDNAPEVSFAALGDNNQFGEGELVSVTVNASDSNGEITSVSLSLDNEFVRTERRAPYGWGAGDAALQNLSPGTYRLTAVAEDNDGLTSTANATFTITDLSLIHISEPTRLGMISYAVFCLK